MINDQIFDFDFEHWSRYRLDLERELVERIHSMKVLIWPSLEFFALIIGKERHVEGNLSVVWFCPV